GEDDPGTRLAGTAREGHRRMKEVLRALEHDRAALAFDADDALDPQQVRPAQLTERLERRVQPVPGERFIEPQAKRMNRGVVASERFSSASRIARAGRRQGTEPAIELVVWRMNRARTDVREPHRIKIA